MAFTQAVISHQYVNGNMTPASGEIVWTLTKAMTNGSVTLVPASVTSRIDASGNLLQSLVSTMDPATTPPDALWRVDVRILGSDVDTFFTAVPSGGVTVDMAGLSPFFVPAAPG